MKRQCLAILLCLAAHMAGFAEAPADLAAQWDKARELYDAGEFRKAAAIYEQILIDRGPSLQAYYNLGNTYFRMEEFGRAALSYERALLMAPNHVEAAMNLSRLRSKMGAIMPEPNFSGRILNAIPHNIAVIAATLLAWLAVFALIFAIFLRRLRFSLVLCGVLFAIVAMAFPILRLTAKGLRVDPSRAVVIEQNAAARYSPALSSPQAKLLPPGSVVTVLLQRGMWSYISTANNERGWIQSASLGHPLPRQTRKEF